MCFLSSTLWKLVLLQGQVLAVEKNTLLEDNTVKIGESQLWALLTLKGVDPDLFSES